MAGRKKAKTGDQLLDERSRTSSPKKDRAWMRDMLKKLVEGRILPEELLRDFPRKAVEDGRTRFDQIYEVCNFLAFPGYSPATLSKFLGPSVDPDVKLWRALFPPKFGLSQVLLRAKNFQEAFALACDYACRLSLSTEKLIPEDLTIRVQFMSDSAVKRMLRVRWANRKKARARYSKSSIGNREFSPKELHGARLVAIGRPGDRPYSIFKYAEMKDIKRIQRKRGETRFSAIEKETFRPKDQSG